MSFIASHDFSAGLVLRVLGISSSTYYGWKQRQHNPSRHQLDDAALLEQIEKIRSVNEFAPIGTRAPNTPECTGSAWRM